MDILFYIHHSRGVLTWSARRQRELWLFIFILKYRRWLILPCLVLVLCQLHRNHIKHLSLCIRAQWLTQTPSLWLGHLIQEALAVIWPCCAVDPEEGELPLWESRSLSPSVSPSLSLTLSLSLVCVVGCPTALMVMAAAEGLHLLWVKGSIKGQTCLAPQKEKKIKPTWSISLFSWCQDQFMWWWFDTWPLGSSLPPPRPPPPSTSQIELW